MQVKGRNLLVRNVNRLLPKQLRRVFKIISSKNPIAFFDSGVGGLTVYSKLKKLLPNEDYIYFGDTKNMPYGEKTKDQLLEYADRIFNFFKSKNAKAVVMACNTTSSVIYDDVKDKYGLKIYPVIQSCAKILAEMPVKRIGVFATNATVNSGAYKKEIQKFNPDIDVIQIACPEWVKIVEENKVSQSSDKVKLKLDEMLKCNPDKIVLGCTHYPYLLSVLSEFAPRDKFIDPSMFFAKFIKDDMEKSGLLTSGSGDEEIFVSANPENFKKAAKLFYDLKDLPMLY